MHHDHDRPLIERVLARLMRARVVVAVVAVVVVVFADIALFGLRVQNDLEAFFVNDDPVMIAWQQFRARYGTDEVVVIAIGDDDTLHSAARRAELAQLTTTLSALPEVDRVQSLANVETIERTHDANGTVDGFVTRTVGDDSERLLREARARHGLLTRLASEDDRTQVVWLWLKADATDDAGRSRAVAAIDAVVQPLRAQHTVRVVGGGLVWEALNGITVRDGAVFISLASLVLLVGLLLVTRRVLWAVVAVVAVSCANIVVLGAMALLHVPLNAITVCLPSLVMALGVLDLLHLIAAVDDLPRDVVDAHDPRVAAALAHVAVPGLFNIVTTVVGLLALLTASTTVTRQLGGFAALGVVCAWVFCLAWTIVAVPRALHPSHRRRRHPDGQRRSPSAMLAALAIRHRVVVIVVAALVAVASVVGITQLRVDTDTLGYLPKQHPLVADTRAVERELGPFIPLEIDLAVPAPGAWRHTALMTALRDASARLTAHGDVVVDDAAADAPAVRFGRAVSVADVVAEVDYALALDDDTPLGDHVDASMALIAATAPGLLDGIVAADDRHLRFTVPVTLTTARGFIAAGDVVDRTLRASLQRAGVTDVTVTRTGYLPLYAQIVHALVDDQVASFAIAFLGVFLLIGLFLRSTRLLLLAALPNLLPIAGVLGLMGAAGIALDVATITIAATILGVVVDDTVHSLHRLRAQLAMHGPGPWPRRVVDDAVLAVARSVGRANLAGNALLAAGFLVLVAASATSLVLVGGLSAVAVGLALIADLVVLPALASFVLSTAVSTSGRG